MEGDREKRVRVQALSNFTRKYNDFTKLIDTEPPSELLTKAYSKVDDCWEKLELAHGAYIEVADIDVAEDDAGVKYLDEPGNRYSEVLTKYASYMKQTSADDRAAQEARAKEIRMEELERQKDEQAIAKQAADAKAQEETVKKFESAKDEFNLALEAFQRFHLGIKDVVDDASDQHKHHEWKKLKEDFT